MIKFDQTRPFASSQRATSQINRQNGETRTSRHTHTLAGKQCFKKATFNDKVKKKKKKKKRQKSILSIDASKSGPEQEQEQEVEVEKKKEKRKKVKREKKKNRYRLHIAHNHRLPAYIYTSIHLYNRSIYSLMTRAIFFLPYFEKKVHFLSKLCVFKV